VVIKSGKAQGKPVKFCAMETVSLVAPEITMPTDECSAGVGNCA
jgi:hypothetical protein